MSDSEDDLLGLPPRSASARRRAQEDDDEDESLDEYADVFRPQKKRVDAATTERSDSDGYVPPARAHVCDECEQTMQEAVFCGECSMTYCLPCDQQYHGASADLRVHYRAPLHGAAPAHLTRQLAAEEAEEQREAERQRRKDDEALERQAAEREAQRRLYAQSDEDDGGRRPTNADPWQRVSTEAADEARRMLRESQDLPPPRRSSSRPRSSAPPQSPNAAWGPQSPARAATRASAGFSPYDATYPGSPTGSGPSRSGTVSFAPNATYSNSSSSNGGRPASSAPALRKTRPASAGMRSMVVLQSARPGSAAVARPRVPAVLQPTRTAVSSSDPSLSGKSRFGKNMLLKSSSAAVIHQKLQPKGGGSSGARAHAGTGAHSNPNANAWLSESATPAQMNLHQSIQNLKSELASLENQRHLYKTAVLKRQKALKDIARIAANLARKPNVPSSDADGFSGSGGGGGIAHSASAKRRQADGGPASSELQQKITTQRTTNELLRLELETLQGQLSALRAVGVSRTAGAAELRSLERERAELVQAVSVNASARELDAFKRAQLVGDLRFAVSESQRTLEARRAEATQAKMQGLHLRNQADNMAKEYEQLQAQLDAWAAKQVS